MILLKRRRLVLWLFKAYFRKWRKTIFISFLAGLIVFFILKFVVNYFIPLVPFIQTDTIGLAGAYTVDNLPFDIVSKLSKGLTHVDSSDKIRPAIASSWEIKDNGKTYIFHLKKNIYFNDGSNLTSKDINYNFLDVTTNRPDSHTIEFNLKNSYSPFLVTTSRPVFKKGFLGVGDYRVKSIDLNGNFVQSISIISIKNAGKEIVYQFYPTEESLKIAFMLGEVSKIEGVKNEKFQNKNMSTFPNVSTERKIDYNQLVAVFYNTKDAVLSDKRLRAALSYAMPDTFSFGQRNFGPFNPNSWVSEDGLTTYQQDFEHANLLLSETEDSSRSSSLVIEIQSMTQYKELSEQIQDLWSKIGIKSKIKLVETLPLDFQVFVGDFNIPKDPDQYTLWHSEQNNNITRYKNLRIDKLLEDGRQTVDVDSRKKIYQDLQKYLLDDPPATFLYNPYVYEIIRK